jgi:hypothetical protein
MFFIVSHPIQSQVKYIGDRLSTAPLRELKVVGHPYSTLEEYFSNFLRVALRRIRESGDELRRMWATLIHHDDSRNKQIKSGVYAACID